MNILEPEDITTPPNPSPRASDHRPAPAKAPRPQPGVLPIGHRCFLPDGTPLALTMSRKVVLSNILDKPVMNEAGEQVDTIEWTYPKTRHEALIVFWVACHQPADWYELNADGLPLYLRYFDFLRAVDEWVDTSCLATMHDTTLTAMVEDFWIGQHANKAEPVDEEKKTPAPLSPEPPASTGPTRPAASSAEETPQG